MPKLSSAEAQEVVAVINGSTTDPAKRAWLRHKHLYGRSNLSRQEFVEACTTIQDKHTGEVAHWLYNRPQQQLEDARAIAEADGTPERYAILKARKWGISTWWLCQLIEACANVPHFTACIVADESSTAFQLLESGKGISDRLPIKLPRKYDNRAMLYFDAPLGSRLDIETAGGQDPCRGSTYRAVHCTEPQIWPEPQKKAIAIENAVADRPGTLISYEGTGYGQGTWWHKFWFDAFQGKNDFQAFFFAWWADPAFDYSMPVPDGALEELVETRSEEEKELVRAYGLGPEQLYWRRYKIRNTFKGDLASFHQEFPSTPDEAFVAQGRPAFVKEYVLRTAGRRRDPIFVGDIVIEDRIDATNGRPVFHLRPNPDGMLTIWHNPVFGRGYCAGVDSGHGVKGGDYSVASMMDVETCEQVAEFRGILLPREYGKLVACLGWHYNMAHLWPEIEGPGIATLDALRAVEYHRIGHRPIFDARGRISGRKIAWSTNAKTRPLIFEEIREHLALDDDGAQYHSEALIAELKAEFVDNTMREDHPSGGNDDCVIAWGIALLARKDCIHSGVLEELEEERPLTVEQQHWKKWHDETDAPTTEDEEYEEYAQ